MLIESSNDAAYALADHANKSGFNFVEAMNKKSVSVGMKDSFFVTRRWIFAGGLPKKIYLVTLSPKFVFI